MKKYLLAGLFTIVSGIIIAQPANISTHKKSALDTILTVYHKKEFIIDTGKKLPYRILYPLNYDRHKKYPLIVVLHGSGERGTNNESQLTHGGKLFIQTDIRTRYPAIVIFPQCPQNSSWNSMITNHAINPAVREINYTNPEPWPLVATYNLIVELIKTERIDKRRVYITGLSMGGFGSFEIAYRHPKVFAAVLPICGGGDAAAYDKRVKKIPFWIFHGEADKIVEASLSHQMVDKLKKIGAKVKYTEYPGVGHNSWDNAFAEPAFISWMLQQKR